MLVAGWADGGVDRLFTEDLSDGAMILGVRIVNPFRSASGVGESD